MWPLGTLITEKVLLLLLMVRIWLEKSSFQMSFGMSLLAFFKTNACFKLCPPFEPLFVYVPCLKVNDELYWNELWSHVVCPQSWKAKQRTFKLAPDVKTLVGPSPEQVVHYTTLVTPAACNQPLQCVAKGQALLQKTQVSLPGKAGTQVPCYVLFNWAFWH